MTTPNTDKRSMSSFAMLTGLAASGALLYDRVPVVWQWYLRNFWWDPDMRSSWSLLSGWPMIVLWAVLTTVAWLVAAGVVLVAVAGVVDWLVSKLLRGDP